MHIRAGYWFAAVVEDPDPTAFTLSGCVVFPGFDFNDFELADRALLISQFPQHKEIIERLTRANCAMERAELHLLTDKPLNYVIL